MPPRRAPAGVPARAPAREARAASLARCAAGAACWRCSPAAAPAAAATAAPSDSGRRRLATAEAQVDRRDRRPRLRRRQGLPRSARPGVVTIRSIFGSGGGRRGLRLRPQHRRRDRHQRPRRHRRIERRARSRPRKSSSSSPTATSSRPKIVGFDPFADVALLEGRARRPRPAPAEARRRRATSRSAQPVAAIGSPFGEQHSLSVGVVSATDRSVKSLTQFQIEGAIQTDASINPGNSGGPLLDADARVVGINQQIETNSGRQRRRRLRGADLGDQALGRPAARKTATPNTPTSASPARRSTRSWPRSSASTPTFGGLLAEVVPGGPAEKAGLEGGDEQAPLPGRRIQHRRRRDPRRSTATTWSSPTTSPA